MEKWGGPSPFAKAIVPGKFLEAFWAGFGNNQAAIPGKDDQLAIRENERATEVGLGPDYLTCLDIEAAEERFDFLFMDGAVEAIKVAFVENRGVDVVLKFLVGPDGFGGIKVGIEEGRPLTPPRGEIELVANDEWVGGIFA